MPLTPPEEKSILQRYLPIVDWLPKYDWVGSLRYDVLSALTGRRGDRVAARGAAGGRCRALAGAASWRRPGDC
jgi:hypothetical protein